MFQPDNLQLQSLDWKSSHFSSTSSTRPVQVVESSATAAFALNNSAPAGLSANKRAVIDRLIHLYAQGKRD